MHTVDQTRKITLAKTWKQPQNNLTRMGQSKSHQWRHSFCVHIIPKGFSKTPRYNMHTKRHHYDVCFNTLNAHMEASRANLHSRTTNLQPRGETVHTLLATSHCCSGSNTSHGRQCHIAIATRDAEPSIRHVGPLLELGNQPFTPLRLN